MLEGLQGRTVLMVHFDHAPDLPDNRLRPLFELHQGREPAVCHGLDIRVRFRGKVQGIMQVRFLSLIEP